MDIMANMKAQKRVGLTESFERVIISIRSKIKVQSKQAVLLCHLLQLAQIVSVMIPESSESGLLWSYEILGGVWGIASFVSRPGKLLQALNFPLNSLLFLVFDILILWAYIKLLIKCRKVDYFDFRSSVSDSGKLERFIQFMNFAFVKLFLIPVIHATLEDLFHLTQQSNHLSVLVGCFLHFAVYFGNCYVEFKFLSEIKWSQDWESVSMPKYNLLKFWLLVAFVGQELLLDFNKYPTGKLGVMLVIGLAYGLMYWTAFPNHRSNLNALEMLKGATMALGALVLGIAYFSGVSQKSVLSPLLFLGLFFSASIITKEASKVRETQISKTGTVDTLNSLEFILRLCRESYLDNTLENLLKKFKREELAYIWVIYCFMESFGKKDTVKYYLSSLMKLGKNSVEATLCKVRVEIWLKSIPDENEFMNFLVLDKRISKCLKLDKKLCFEYLSLNTAKEKNRINFSKFTQKLERIEASMEELDKTYKSTLSLDVCRGFPLAYEYYIGYLRSILNNEKVEELVLCLKNSQEALEQARKKPEEILFADFENVFLKVVSDKIAVCRNVTKLGYNYEEALEMNFGNLFPKPLRKHYLRTMCDYSEENQLFKGVHNLLILSKSETLLKVKWKCRLHCEEDGSLSKCICIKTIDHTEDLAMFNPQTLEVTYMTEGFWLFITQQLTTGSLELSGVNLEDGSEVLRHKSLSVRVKTITLDPDCEFKVFVLHQKRGYEWVPCSYTSGLEGSYPSFSHIKGPKKLVETSKDKKAIYSDCLSFYNSEKISKSFYIKTFMDRMKSRLNLLKFAILVTIILFFVFNFLEFILLNENLGKLSERILKVEGERRLSTASAASYSRDLQLVCEGYEWPTNEDFIRNQLTNTASTLNKYARDYPNNYENHEFLWFESVNRVFIEQRMNMINLLANIALNTNLMAIRPCKDLNNTSAPFLNLFRNCPAEALKSINTTIHLNSEHQQAKAESSLENFITAMLSILLCVVLASSATILVFISRVMNYRKKYWNKASQVDKSVFSEIKGRVMNRLSSVHDCEPFEEDSNGKEQWRYKTHPKFKKLIALVVGLFILQAVSAVTSVVYLYRPVEKLVIQAPVYVNNVSTLGLQVRIIDFWIRELALVNSTQSYYSIIPEKRNSISPSLLIEKEITRLKYFRSRVVKDAKKFQSQGKNLESFAMLFERACLEESCNSIIKKGIIPGLQEYIDYVYFLKSSLENGHSYRNLYREFFKLTRFEIQLEEVIQAFLKLYGDFVSSKDEELLEIMTVFVCVVTFVSLFVFYTLIFLVISSIWTTAKKEIHYLMLLPQVNPGSLFKELLNY